MDLNTSIAACLDTETYNPSTYNRLKYDSKYKYVCSGVLMMNLDRWRTLNLSRKIVDFAKKIQRQLNILIKMRLMLFAEMIKLYSHQIMVSL